MSNFIEQEAQYQALLKILRQAKTESDFRGLIVGFEALGYTGMAKLCQDKITELHCQK